MNAKEAQNRVSEYWSDDRINDILAEIWEIIDRNSKQGRSSAYWYPASQRIPDNICKQIIKRLRSQGYKVIGYFSANTQGVQYDICW